MLNSLPLKQIHLKYNRKDSVKSTNEVTTQEASVVYMLLEILFNRKLKLICY